jgi:ADP-heptose:LPS heptosyltransferase
MTELSGARYRAGFRHFRQQFVYNVAIPRAQEILKVDRKVHTAEHLASAAFFLGAPVCEIPRAKLFSAGRPPSVAGPRTAVIHAVAAQTEKSWTASGFLAVADQLAQGGYSPVFAGGSEDDLAAFRHYPTLQSSLSDLKSLLASATLFVGNDSGPAHMAAAFGVPSIVIFGPSDPMIWGPWHTPGEAVVAQGGIQNVTVSQVLDALQRLRVAA